MNFIQLNGGLKVISLVNLDNGEFGKKLLSEKKWSSLPRKSHQKDQEASVLMENFQDPGEQEVTHASQPICIVPTAFTKQFMIIVAIVEHANGEIINTEYEKYLSTLVQTNISRFR